MISLLHDAPPEATTTPVETEMALDKATIQQLTWKNKIMAAIAVVVLTSLELGRKYADELDFSKVGTADRNCIGITWRNLKKLGMIRRTGGFRPSEKKSRHGNPVMQWEIDPGGRGLVKQFLKRNAGFSSDPQEKLI